MADFASHLDLLGSSPSDSASARTPSPNSWSYSPPGSVESMLTPPTDFPPPPSVFFHQHHQHHHTGIAFWPAPLPHSSLSAAGPVPLPGRANSFLAEMYDDKDAAHANGHKSLDGSGMYLSPPGGIFRADWELGGSVGNSSAESSPSVHNLAPPPSAPAHESSYYHRRATYPYVRHDEPVYHSSPRNDASAGPVYAEPLSMDHAPQPLAADPAHLHARPLEDSAQYVHHQQHQQPQHGHHPHSQHHNHHHHPHAHAHAHSHGHPDDVKLESSAPIVAGHQYYRPQQTAQPGPPPSAQPIPAATAPTYMTHAGGIPIMHTDDAASKETQYLRRRCFNCHTTEPPSWRRSTLNPGKIVCNKCGLYERTHLRPRPHRFDELRATSKARKAASKGAAQPAQQQQAPMPMVHQQHIMHQQAPPQQQQQQPPQHVPSPSLSPKSQHGSYVKKEPADEYDMRRASVGSVGSANMNGGHEWDHNAVHRLSHSPPSSHAASPIRLPSLPGAPMGSRTPEPRPYVERRPSLPFDVPPSQRPREEDPSVQQWSQGATMSVADLVDEEKARKTPTI